MPCCVWKKNELAGSPTPTYSRILPYRSASAGANSAQPRSSYPVQFPFFTRPREPDGSLTLELEPNRPKTVLLTTENMMFPPRKCREAPDSETSNVVPPGAV